MGYVARALRRGRLAEVSACVIGRKLAAYGPRLRRHFLLAPADDGCAAGRNNGCAGAGRPARQGFICGHFIVQSGANARGSTDFEERRCTAAHSSAVLLYAEPLG